MDGERIHDTARPARTRARVGACEVSLLDLPGGRNLPPRRPPVSMLEVIAPLEGPVAVHLELGTPLAVRENEVVYLAGGHRYVIGGQTAGRVLVVAVPESVVIDYIETESLIGSVHESAVLQPVKRFLRGLLEIAEPLGALPEYLIETLLWEMVVSIVLEGRSADALVRPRATCLDRATAYILANRADRALTPATVARAVGVSPRQLQRVFMSAGTTPSGEIRRQRAELARSMLQNDDFRGFTVNQIAHHSGFGGAAELRRVFSALGHPAPRSLRLRSTPVSVRTPEIVSAGRAPSAAG
ncbi:helix-turn-helix domain-containing protein [Herbiconiux sp. UC225_62]|uniref:AraC family transcriptional regulator n=1 Tax=Herbiconiux sp. UC225_62 TaxID=3350168 RepID=UPI0036D2A4FE